MKDIQVGKVVVNISAGQVGEQVDRAEVLLEKLTDTQPVRTESKADMKTFGGRAGLNIGAAVTLRGDDAEKFLEKVLPAADVSASSFDGDGNLSFGIDEYIDVSGVEYDGDIGMMGFEVAVSLERPGYRVERRDHNTSEIGPEHRVSDEEAKEFVQESFEVSVQ